MDRWMDMLKEGEHKWSKRGSGRNGNWTLSMREEESVKDRKLSLSFTDCDVSR